jgi:hypothetical protein
MPRGLLGAAPSAALASRAPQSSLDEFVFRWAPRIGPTLGVARALLRSAHTTRGSPIRVRRVRARLLSAMLSPQPITAVLVLVLLVVVLVLIIRRVTKHIKRAIKLGALTSGSCGS